MDYLSDGPSPGNFEGQFNNGYITGLVTEDMFYYYLRIEEKIKEYGWDREGE
jgi:hypothetical protein